MKLLAGEHYVEFVPETDWEVQQLKRLDIPREHFTTELVEKPGDSYPPSMKLGARLRICIPTHYWGT
jgi:hypothetical protein